MEAGIGYTCEGNGRLGSWFSYVSTYGTFNPPGSPVPTTLLGVARGEMRGEIDLVVRSYPCRTEDGGPAAAG
jgi:hypothetical protein